ncbi:MAG: cation transporter, partial [Bdellovibrio sp.]
MHSHSHHHSSDLYGRALWWSFLINMLLTVVQVVTGVVSGSVSLIADAAHNFSDAGALGVAAFARRIARIPANERMTYGYRRAEILGALINSTSLLLVGLYLIYESVLRLYSPREVNESMMMWVSGVALIINLLTAFLTFKGSRESLNIKAAFLHNLTDAMASVVVLISGFIILYTKIYFIDSLAGIGISIYVIYHSYYLIKESVLILMQSVPHEINVKEVCETLSQHPLVKEVHHVHIWRLDDKKKFFEGHIVIDKKNLDSMEEI